LVFVFSTTVMAESNAEKKEEAAVKAENAEVKADAKVDKAEKKAAKKRHKAEKKAAKKRHKVNKIISRLGEGMCPLCDGQIIATFECNPDSHP
jgi:mannitol-specific phosphotransferase system IIBC component